MTVMQSFVAKYKDINGGIPLCFGISGCLKANRGLKGVGLTVGNDKGLVSEEVNGVTVVKCMVTANALQHDALCVVRFCKRKAESLSSGCG